MANIIGKTKEIETYDWWHTPEEKFKPPRVTSTNGTLEKGTTCARCKKLITDKKNGVDTEFEWYCSRECYWLTIGDIDREEMKAKIDEYYKKKR